MIHSELPSLAPDLGIAAINLGFGWAKISLDGVEEKFMSVISHQQKNVGMKGAESENPLNLVHCDGEAFEVGLEAAELSWSDPTPLV